MNEHMWRKSSYSVDNNCFVIADTLDGVLVRNSNKPDAGTLVVPKSVMAAWIAGCKAGEFDDLT